MTKDFASLHSLLRIGPADVAGFETGLEGDADALIVDLMDAEPALRALAGRAAGLAGRPMLLAEIRNLTIADAALDATMPLRPDGIVLRACGAAADVQHLGAKLAVREAEFGLPHGSTPILAMAGSSAAGLLALPGFAKGSPRLAALGWDAADLARNLGAEPLPGEPAGDEPFRTAAALLLFGARAAGVSAIDTPTRADAATLAAQCQKARRMGYGGKIAIDAAQVAIINARFRQSRIAPPGGS